MIGQAKIVHHIPGRLRFTLPRAKGNHAVLRFLRDSVSRQYGVRRVEVNPTIGSVVVYYDPGAHEDYAAHLTKHAEDTKLFALKPPEMEVDAMVHGIEEEAEFLAERSEVARHIVNAVKQLNEGIKSATGNMVDLNVLLPLAAALLSLSEAGLDMPTPLWVTMGIFSFNSFINLHYPKPRSEVDRRDVIVAHSTKRARAVRGKATAQS